jgi:hypothetical protein
MSACLPEVLIDYFQSYFIGIEQGIGKTQPGLLTHFTLCLPDLHDEGALGLWPGPCG